MKRILMTFIGCAYKIYWYKWNKYKRKQKYLPATNKHKLTNTVREKTNVPVLVLIPLKVLIVMLG